MLVDDRDGADAFAIASSARVSRCSSSASSGASHFPAIAS